MKHRLKKGFTLTELIVVIVIIGILAAVLIPTLTMYIEKARKSNDTQTAAQMTRELQYYCLDNDLLEDKLIGTDVRTIMLGLGYDLKPSTTKWTYVYDANKKQISVKEFGSNEVLAAFDYANAKDPTNYAENKFIVGKGNTKIEKAITQLCTYDGTIEFSAIIAEIEGNSYENLLKAFNPSETLYVSNARINNNPTSIKKVVYTELTFNIPDLTDVAEKFEEGLTITLPEIISSVNEETKEKLSEKITNINSVKNKIVCQTIDLTDYELNVDANGNVSGDVYTFSELVNDTICQTFTTKVKGYVVKREGQVNKIYLVYNIEICYYKVEGLSAKGTKDFEIKIDDDKVDMIRDTYKQL